MVGFFLIPYNRLIFHHSPVKSRTPHHHFPTFSPTITLSTLPDNALALITHRQRTAITLPPNHSHDVSAKVTPDASVGSLDEARVRAFAVHVERGGAIFVYRMVSCGRRCRDPRTLEHVADSGRCEEWECDEDILMRKGHQIQGSHTKWKEQEN